VPIDDDVDRDRVGWLPADRPERMRLIADAYGLEGDDRSALLGSVDDALDRIEAPTRRSVAAGHAATTALWDAAGGAARFTRRRAWWTAHRAAFAAALA
jgi:hypothetical protein